MTWDRIAIVDWSGGNQGRATPQKDAIWIGTDDGAPSYMRHRGLAEAWLENWIEERLSAGEHALIGFDFPFGYPQGFARAVTGSDDPFSLWDWLEHHIEDTPTANNRFDVAASLNRLVGAGQGPFWGNALGRDIEGLQRNKQGYANPFPDKRLCERQAAGAFTCWQLAGAGAVGSQVLMGLPVLNRLRRRFVDKVSVWPFEPLNTPIAFVEVWPGLINDVVRKHDGIRDAVQVRLMARSLAALEPKDIDQMLAVEAPEEGWILGLGHEAALSAAAETGGLKPPPLRNDCFAMPPGVDWTPVDDALARLRDRLHRVVGVDSLHLSQAGGRILAEDAIAARAHPPAANAAVDGYGFAHRATRAGDQTLPLVSGRAAAGAPYRDAVLDGHAIRILTGALLPQGVDTIVLEEDCTTDGTAVAFRGPIKPGANTRAAGEDLAKGDIALNAGTRLTPGALASLAATGTTELKVFQPLRVGVLSTGDEIAAPGSTDDPARTYDANRPMLLDLLAGWRLQAVDLGHVGDDRAALHARLDLAARDCDAILTSGGASAGDEDHLSALLGETGTRSDWRIALKPGRPLALGIWRGTPVFGLPGNPVAALVCTLIFARPAFGVLSGEGWRAPQGFMVPAAFTKSKKPGRREYLRARLTPEGTAEIFASEGSGRVSGLAWADGLVELADEAGNITPGTPVRYLPFSGFGPG